MAHVLIAVSNGAIRASLAQAARTGGHTAYAVLDAGDLVAMVERQHPDLLFLDPDLARLAAVKPLKDLKTAGLLDKVRIVLVDDRRHDPGPWGEIARQMADGILDSFREGDVQWVIEGLTGLGRGKAQAAGAAKAPPAPVRPPATPSSPLRAPQPPPPAAAPGPPRQGRSILVVEDAPTYRALLGIRLDAEGWDVKWAGTAEEGLQVVEEQGCDAILSDLNLPGMSGDALLEIVRKRYPGVALFLMTAAPKERWPRVPPSIPIYPKPVDMDLLMRRLKVLAASAKRPGGRGTGLPGRGLPPTARG